MSGDSSSAPRTRLLKATDKASVTALLAAIFNHNPAEFSEPCVHGPSVNEPGRYRRTLVVEANDNLVGVGTIWEYWLHPARWRLTMHVSPRARQRGVGTALLDQLVGMTSGQDQRPLHVALSADNIAGQRFLNRSGFSLLMRTRRGTVNTRIARAVVQPVCSAATEHLTGAGYRIAMLSDRGPDMRQRDALADLHAEIYRLGHAWNPTPPITRPQAQRLFMDENEIIPDAFAVGLLDDQPVAVASLRRGPTAGTLDLGWVGVTNPHRTLRDAFTVALVGRCLASVAGRYEVFTVEIDETDAPLRNLMGRLPVRWDADWLTVVRPYHNTSGLTS